MSDCGVCIGGDSIDGYVEMYAVRAVRSRREHKCVECRRAIPKGSEYQRASYFWEGAFETQHTCLDCAEIKAAFDCSQYDEALQYGELWGAMEQAFPTLTTGCLAKLSTVSAKEYLLERWRTWKGLAA